MAEGGFFGPPSFLRAADGHGRIKNQLFMKSVKLWLIIFAIVLAGIFLFWKDFTDFYFQLENRLTDFFTPLEGISSPLTGFIEKIEKQIVTPPPLRAVKEAPESFLTKAGVIAFTNSQREKNGLPPLKENTKLDESAELKAQDMLKNQYFAHDSPSGVTVGNLADGAGYQFIAIGENLALGNFENDEVLVQAWMDSPGHRANILNNRYQEIGVMVLKGTFEGNSTWLAVQHFGLPLSVCPSPDETIKITITADQNKIDEIFKELETLQTEIRTMSPKRGSVYQEKINQYNELVAEYNLLIEQAKLIINGYNRQVRLFNECLMGIPE